MSTHEHDDTSLQDDDEVVLFQNEWLSVIQRKWDTLDHPYTLVRPRLGLGACVIPLRYSAEGEPEVLMLSQPRPPFGELLWEFPAGGVDDGEVSLHAAVRELGEETNIWVTPEDLISLGDHSLFPSLVEETLSVYLCVLPDDYNFENIHPQAGEIDGLLWVNLRDAFVRCATDKSYSFSSLGKLVLVQQYLG